MATYDDPFATASGLVTTQFNEATAYGETAFDKAVTYLTALQNFIATLSYQVGNLTENWPVPSISIDQVTVPTGPDADFNAVALPTAPAIPDIEYTYQPNFPENTANFSAAPPVDNLVAPTPQFIFSESPYASQLLTDLRAKLDWYVQNGGTGLGPEIEKKMWEDAKFRVQQENERVYEQAEDFWSARGFTRPPGALNAAITEAITEQTRKLMYNSHEILTEMARLAHDQTDKTMGHAANIEMSTQNYFGTIAARSLEAAKFTVTASLEIFKAAIDYFNAQVNIYKTEADVYLAQVEAYKAEVQAETSKIEGFIAQINAQVAVAKLYLDQYTTEIEAYKAQTVFESERIGALLKLYAGQTTVYDAQIRLVLGEYTGQVSLFDAEVREDEAQARLLVEQARLNLDAYLGRVNLIAKALEEGAGVAAHLASGAMAGIHAAASISASGTEETYDDISSPVTSG